MNINFGSLFGSERTDNQSMIQSQPGEVQNTEQMESVQSGQNDQKIADLRSMLPGQFFNGEISDIRGMDVKIILSDQSFVNATMNEAVNLNIGDHVIFQVKDNSESQVVIKPVQIEDGTNELITKALDTAGISSTDKNMAVVRELIMQEQPVDKNTVMDTIRISNQFPTENLSDIVELNKHNIPVNEENLNMMETYRNNEGSIMNNVSDVAEKLVNFVSDTCNAEMAKENVSVSENLLNDVLKIAFWTDGEQDEMQAGMQVKDNNVIDNEKNNVDNSQINETERPNMEVAENDKSSFIQSEKSNNNLMADANANNIGEKNIQNKSEGYQNILNNSNIAGNDKEMSALEKDLAKIMQNPVQGMENAEKDGGVESRANTIGQSAENLFNQLTKEVENSDNPDLKKVYKEINGILGKIDNPEVKAQIVNSDSFKQLIKKSIVKQMVPDAKQYASDDNPKKILQETYEKLQKEIVKLEESVKQYIKNGQISEKAAQPLMNSIKTTAQNLNFMNDLNNMTSYVQIPVKMNQEEKAGELYVYNKNKNKSAEEGLSAILHFDLAHLGATDINLYLKGKNLRMEFSLEDMESIRIVDEHIDELNVKLEDKGFNVNSQVVWKQPQQKENQLDRILNHDKNQVAIKRYTFDIRT